MPGSALPEKHVPIALTIAGSDPSGGAGIQADLRTFDRFGVSGVSVVTALTAQSRARISAIHPLPPQFIAEQYIQIMSDTGADAVKTGMLWNIETVEVVAGIFKEHPPPNLVVDPVIKSSSGVELLESPAVDAMIELILPNAILVTPNLDEAERIVGSGRIDTVEAMAKAARKIHMLGPQAVLVKGGHLPAEEDAVDLLYDGNSEVEFSSPRLECEQCRGTGCTLSAAIAACLAKSEKMENAVLRAKNYISEVLQGRPRRH